MRILNPEDKEYLNEEDALRIQDTAYIGIGNRNNNSPKDFCNYYS